MIELVEADEAAEMIRQDVMVLLSKDPHCPVANLLGQALMDSQEHLI